MNTADKAKDQVTDTDVVASAKKKAEDRVMVKDRATASVQVTVTKAERKKAKAGPVAAFHTHKKSAECNFRKSPKDAVGDFFCLKVTAFF